MIAWPFIIIIESFEFEVRSFEACDLPCKNIFSRGIPHTTPLHLDDP